MININNPADCCGCTACASICAHDAITMKPDALGFLYPEVDRSKCVDCGLCEKVCAFNDDYDKSFNIDKPLAYAARHKTEEELRYSRSGAVFVAMSDYILEHSGVVYGAGYADHFRVVHKRATTKEECSEFKGSKYVQSDMNTVFRQVKQDLKAGLAVLFSGTPCQTAGLNSYIGKAQRKNLILIDIICHAVPSPSVWKDYLGYTESKFKSNVIKLEFREKSIGWNQPHMESFTLADNSIHKDFLLRNLILIDIICHAVPSPSVWKDYLGYTESKFKSNVIKLEFREKSIGWNQPHMESFTLADNSIHKDFLLRYLFYSGLISRPSCEHCKYCNLSRPSDLTIGDFWGYEKVAPEMNTDNKGISLVICNTDKGCSFFRECSYMLHTKHVDLMNSLQPNLQHPSFVDPRWHQFAKDYQKRGFLYVARKYGNVGYRYQLRMFMDKIKRKLSI